MVLFKVAKSQIEDLEFWSTDQRITGELIGINSKVVVNNVAEIANLIFIFLPFCLLFKYAVKIQFQVIRDH
jgi:hypothetical protein